MPNFRKLHLACTKWEQRRNVCLRRPTKFQTRFTDIFSHWYFFNMIIFTHETFTSEVTEYSQSLCTIICWRKISSDTTKNKNLTWKAKELSKRSGRLAAMASSVFFFGVEGKPGKTWPFWIYQLCTDRGRVRTENIWPYIYIYMYACVYIW